MNAPGIIQELDSSIELFSSGFGGCTAIYAKTEQICGLYHLQGTSKNGTNNRNKTYKDSLIALKETANGEEIQFEIGSPRNSLRELEVGNLLALLIMTILIKLNLRILNTKQIWHCFKHLKISEIKIGPQETLSRLPQLPLGFNLRRRNK
ncbi:hypothetical protein [Legionella cardiaca]|uniref:Uncharacterized protein n=1 Tax=Legionella cardiaca TaxID=1071983 RepID=A0ABY8AU79_9GAMM|nr:hypothetical protein [Legionella cardiaca]WED44250.1 hypothetical protein PXX05_05550 [Legionella cardiaca]